MVFGYFTLFVALMISAVAEFYSIVGLTAIFSAAFWPVVIMGASLGVGKITAAVWLKLNWERANWTYKIYLVPAVAFLMALTSMGIFGYLSKAHSDQSLVSGDAVAKVAIYDEKISTAKDNIATNRKALKQMDEAVDQVMARSDDEKGADKAVAVRRSQQKERARLLAEIEVEQKKISALSEERAPLAAEFRKVESEVGPIKYIAALVYGDNPDANILEKAVRLVIIMIVAVFDPLALVLILAAQQSLRWAKEEKDKGPMGWEHEWVGQEINQPSKPTEVESPEPEPEVDKYAYLKKPFVHFQNLKPMVATPPEPEIPTGTVYVDPPDWGTTPIPDVERPGDYLTLPEEETESIKAAQKAWKEANPDSTLKEQRVRLARGEIDHLPWLDLIPDNADKNTPVNGFGISFPNDAKRGDSFIRVDQLPNVLYKYDGQNWIIVDKNLSDNYTYNEAYIDHLIAKLGTGEYDIDMLSDSEREQVTQRLQSKAQ